MTPTILRWLQSSLVSRMKLKRWRQCARLPMHVLPRCKKPRTCTLRRTLTSTALMLTSLHPLRKTCWRSCHKFQLMCQVFPKTTKVSPKILSKGVSKMISLKTLDLKITKTAPLRKSRWAKNAPMQKNGVSSRVLRALWVWKIRTLPPCSLLRPTRLLRSSPKPKMLILRNKKIPMRRPTMARSCLMIHEAIYTSRPRQTNKRLTSLGLIKHSSNFPMTSLVLTKHLLIWSAHRLRLTLV